MDHHGSHTHRRHRQSDAPELGNDPPLSVDGGTAEVIDRRRVSVQWFSGTILTALCGAALMGGAVFTSLDGETNFAALPERVEIALRGALGATGERLGLARKGDRLPVAEEPNIARQTIRVSTTTRVGDHEVVRVRPFVRVAGNLSLSVTELTANIPPYNAQRLFAEATADDSPDGNPTNAAPAPDAEVAYVMRDLPAVIDRIKIASLTSNDEVLSLVRETADNFRRTAQHLPAGTGVSGVRLAYATAGTPDPYKGFEARVVPENVTLLPKTTSSQVTGGNPWSERVLTATSGSTVASLLREIGAAPDEIKSIQAVLGGGARDLPLKDGQKLRVMLAPVSNAVGARLQPVRVVVTTDSNIEAVVALTDTGKFVAVDINNADKEIADARGDKDDDTGGVRLYQSVYETALRNNIPRPVVDDLIRIYSYDVDFQRRVQPGDSFEVLYGGEDDTPASDAQNEVHFAALTIGGEIKKFYRFQSSDDGIVDYYDDTGKSAKKFLVRKPLADGTMRSAFGMRRHPILGYTKMHTGVDWSAPTGTPIYASGNGIVEKVGWESGYGKYVRIRHINGYETAYGHMTAYARGIEEGKRVRQGQVIGFVGSTGLSTGAHLHYEIVVNGRFVDPMRIKLPRGRVLEGRMLTAFERERQRIDGIMTRKPAQVAATAIR